MWKKLLIVFMSLIGVCSVGYAYYNEIMNATGTAYQVPASATMKLGGKGLYPDGTTGSMNKGDKVYVGTNTAAGTPMSFILLANERYYTYKVQVNASGVYSLGSASNMNGWFAMANEMYDTVKYFDGTPTFTKMANGTTYMVKTYLTTEPASKMARTLSAANASMSDKTKKIVIERNLKAVYDYYTQRSKHPLLGVNFEEILHHALLNPKGFFIGDEFTMLDVSFSGSLTKPSARYSLEPKDLIFPEAYAGTYVFGSGTAQTITVFSMGGFTPEGNYSTAMIKCVSPQCDTTTGLRLSAELYMDDVVFATGTGTGSTFTEIKNSSPTLDNYSNIYTATENYDKLKLRILDRTGNHAIIFNDIQYENNVSITEASRNSTIYLDAEAREGSNDGDVNTVSALFFKDNELVYYVPVAAAAGNKQYAIDLTGLDLGKYKVALVNESYNENDLGPVECSALTDFKDLEIKELVFLEQDGLLVNDNVNIGDEVGVIISQPGIVYTIIEDPAYPGEHTHLTMASDGKTVIVNGNPLHAGTYHFKIKAQDANNGSNPSVEINESITVAQENTAIAFDDPNQTKKSIAQATTGWSETANATPKGRDGLKVMYAKSGGSVGLINIDSNTGAITYSGGTGYGKVIIKATADDDPTSGYDDFIMTETTKEIVIYREVDGNVTPHTDSSDTTTPTFQTSDSNIKPNGIIGTISGTLGTPDNAESGKTTYTYAIKDENDYNYFSVNPTTGEITTTADLSTTTGTYHITVTVSDKWSTKEIPVTISVGLAPAEELKFYEDSTANKVINTKTVNFSDTNISVFATVKGSSNSNPVTYRIQDGSTNVITINPNNGAITIKGTGTVTIVAEKAGNSGQADAQATLTLTVTAGEQNLIYTTDSTLEQEMPKNSTTGKYLAYEVTYEPNGTFNVYTKGNPAGSQVTYRLKAGSPEDVISVDSDGTIHILNASMSVQIGKVFVEATSHDPNGNYDDKTIELPITIKKANQTVSFAEDPIYATSGKGSVTPVIDAQDISSNAGGAIVEDTKTLISIDSSVDKAIAKTTDGQTITYNYDKEGGIDIPIHVIKQGNRNYEKAEADGTLHIMGPDESILIVSDVGEVEYGEHFMIESLQDDSASVNVKYTFTVDDTTYITSPTVNGNQAEFDAIKITGSKKVTITITRTADSEKPLSVKKQITVVPKEIEITIEDKEKLKGEVNPPLTYEDFSDQLVEWNGTKDDIQAGDVKLSTTANQTSPAGDYPIKGDANYLNKAYPNYQFTFVEGTLTIKEENIEDDWYHMETDDGQPYQGDWTNQDVNIVTDHDEYVNLSKDQSSWNKDFVSVTQEGNYEQSFWMKKDSGAITSEKKETIKIDKTAPKVKSIKAKDSNNKLQDIINKLSGGIFFKPGTSFEITTSDANEDLEVSGTNRIAYKIYKKATSRSTGDPIQEDTITVMNEKANITISETVGTYEVCVIPTDKAGNTGTESCHEVTLKKINVDEDEDGKPDFVDPDGDGCPDLNIKWKDDDGKWIVINGDRDDDGIPDLNIDSDGDGKADMNIDTDHDGKPDLNLVVLKKADWKPIICVNADEDKGIREEYCTGTSVKPQINVDTDNDGIPNINIDTDGDFKADFNVDTDGDNKADVNIGTVHTPWKPDKDFVYQNFQYDTDAECKPYLNIDSDGDGKADVNVDVDGDGKPDINIDVDDDGKPDTNIDSDNDNRADINIDLDGDGKPDINIDTDDDGIPNVDIDSDGDGRPDINVDTDGDGKPDENIREITEWKPDHNVDGDIPYDTMNFDDPDDSDKADDSNGEEPDTDVKGSYYPGESTGGALTGDTTNMMMYMGMGCMSIGMMLLILFKRNQAD